MKKVSWFLLVFILMMSCTDNSKIEEEYEEEYVEGTIEQNENIIVYVNVKVSDDIDPGFYSDGIKIGSLYYFELESPYIIYTSLGSKRIQISNSIYPVQFGYSVSGISDFKFHISYYRRENTSIYSPILNIKADYKIELEYFKDNGELIGEGIDILMIHITFSHKEYE